LPFEHYKTQVLLLHSEQSALDDLSAGFNEKYSVHCATSGTEALNTLGDTPIHVIVSAQELPGMSGLDALREAKKRSPDTIGILLAGSDKEDGLEALVGDEEVFQIVRGSVTAETLLSLVDSATQRMRLMALAESANDQAANVDEPVSEHIVMETSENGSAIISDGTSRMPALQPHKIEIAPDTGSRNVDVLLMTKDEEFLTTIKDSARGLHNVHHAVTPTQAENFVRDKTVGVLVTDAAMVGSDIESLTHKLRKERPRMVAIVAGRRDDGEMLMDLINRGQVYRFLLKPVSPGRARLAIEASVKHHLEAPDAAFESKPSSASPRRKPKAKTRTKPLAKLKPAAKPKPVTEPIAVAKQKPEAADIPVLEPDIQPIPVLQPEIQPIPTAQSKARKKAEAEAKKKAEAEANKKAKAEARKKAEAEAKKKAEGRKQRLRPKRKPRLKPGRKRRQKLKRKPRLKPGRKRRQKLKRKRRQKPRRKRTLKPRRKPRLRPRRELRLRLRKGQRLRPRRESRLTPGKRKRRKQDRGKRRKQERKKKLARSNPRYPRIRSMSSSTTHSAPSPASKTRCRELPDLSARRYRTPGLSREARRKPCRHRAKPLQVPLAAQLRHCVSRRRCASPAARL
jgi:serine/threonine-protein kinase